MIIVDNHGIAASNLFTFAAQTLYRIVLFGQFLWYLPSDHGPFVLEPINWFFTYLLWLPWCNFMTLHAIPLYSANGQSTVRINEINDDQMQNNTDERLELALTNNHSQSAKINGCSEM